MRAHSCTQLKQKQCLHQFRQTPLLLVSWQIGQFASSEASGGASWGTWLVPASREEVPCSAESSSDPISHCERKRDKARELPWRRNLQEAAKMLKRCLLCLGAVLVLPQTPGIVLEQTSDTRGTSVCSCSPAGTATDLWDTCGQELGRQESGSQPLSESTTRLGTRQVGTGAPGPAGVPVRQILSAPLAGSLRDGGPSSPHLQTDGCRPRTRTALWPFGAAPRLKRIDVTGVAGDGWSRRCWRWWQRATAPEKRGERRADHGCAHCSKAAQELQRLMLLARTRPGVSLGLGSSFVQDPGAWQAAWQDLEELGEWGHLPCHSCSFSGSSESLGPPESLSDTHPIPDGGAPIELGSARSLGPAHGSGACSALKMHVARKGLEVQLGALPVPVQLSQQRAAQQQGRRVLPKLIRPGQSQPLRRCKLCPSLQGKADAIADNISQKEVRRLWGDPNPTEESLALLVPCPPPLLAPLDPQLPREHGVWGPRALGQAGAAWHPRVGQQELHSRHGSRESVHAPLPARPVSLAEQTSPRDLSVSNRHPDSSLAVGGGVCSSIQPPAVGNIMRESLLQPDGQLPQGEEFLWPLGLSLALPALPKLDSKVAGPAAAGPPSVLPEEDAGLQTRFAATRGSGEAKLADTSRPNAAAPVVISKVELSQEVRSRLWVHTARKCLEIKLQRLPEAVQQPMETLHRSLPQRLRTGTGSPRPHCARVPVLNPQRHFQPDQGSPQQRKASLAQPVASATPPSHPVPTYVYSCEATYMSEKQHEALQLHFRTKRLQRCREQLGREGPSERAVPGEEGGRAVLRGSSRPSTAQAAAPAPSTSRGPGSSPPVSLETLRWSRRQVLRALDSGFQDMARSQRQRDVPQSPGPAPPLPPPSHVGKGIGKRAEGPRVPTTSATMGRPWRGSERDMGANRRGEKRGQTHRSDSPNKSRF
ncbi:uncharacterized protein [Haliaeetus albicilla]|uniref:uncharacterized protein n=1 Tax=Haliaeetus albicilla TaxID=8969 RepID=UPI0037E785B6